MARNPGDEDKAHFVGGASGYYSIVINDSEKVRVTSDGTSIVVPVLSGANATATAVISGTEHIVIADPSSTDMGLTLPAASVSLGKTYTVKKIGGSANVSLSGATTSELIDGEIAIILESNSASLSVTCDGVGWHVTSFFSATRTVW